MTVAAGTWMDSAHVTAKKQVTLPLTLVMLAKERQVVASMDTSFG